MAVVGSKLCAQCLSSNGQIVRKSEIRDSFGLATYTRAFNRLLELARQAGLIRLKYPESLHHKNQRYLI